MNRLPHVIACLALGGAPALGEIVPLEGPLGRAIAVRAGVRVVSTIRPIALPNEWADAPTFLLLEVECAGAIGGGNATGSLALRRKDGGALGTITLAADLVLPKEARAGWTVSASSENLGPSEPAEIARAFDGDAASFWHTRWEQGITDALPHQVTIEFAVPVAVVGLRYLPRQHGSSNGTIGKYRIEVIDSAGTKHALAGEWTAESPRAAREARFDAPIDARSLTLIATTEIHGQSFASAAEIEPIFATPAPTSPRSNPTRREYLRVPSDRLGGADSLVLELRGVGETPLAIESVRLHRLPERPTRAMLGKSNGVDGPDRVDLGPLGIDTFTAHDHAVLPIMTVRDRSPAARAGLVAGDVIVGVDGAPLPRSSCAVGAAWFERGHEPVFGRAIEAAQARTDTDARRLVLDVIRADGRREEVALTLDAPALPNDFPFDDGATSSLERDLVDYVVRTQKPDGSWSTDGADFIRTTLSALALLGTRDPAHGERVLRAVRWMMNRFSEPDRFGNLGYWSAGYATILAAEWHLATGDRSVLPFLANTFEWAATTTHTSAWKTPTLGHGPDGLPYEYKSLVAPATHLLVGESLGKRCGVVSRLWETLLPFMEQAWSDPSDGGHGALGYNASFKDLEEFWSRSGLFALAATLRGERLDMARAMTTAMREHHVVMRGSHAYGAPGNVLGLVGLSVADPRAFAEVMRLWRFSFTAAWEPGFGLRYSTPHMGSPYMGEEGLINPGFAVVLTARRKGLHITGATDRDWLPLESIAGRDEGAALQLRRGRDGRVWVVAPGCQDVRIELDGETPTKDSPRYLGPFPVREFGAVVATAFAEDGAPIATARRAFTRSKSAFSVIEATGYLDSDEARRRAEALFDEDGGRSWVVDRGEGAPGVPHRVVFDIGEARTIHGLIIDAGEGSPREVEVRVGEESNSLAHAATAEFEKRGRQIVRFSVPRTVGVVELIVKSTFDDRLAIAEVDVLESIATPRRDGDGRVVIESPIEADEIRYTTDGSLPNANSRRYAGPFSFTGGWVLTRVRHAGVAGRIGGAWLEPPADSK